MLLVIFFSFSLKKWHRLFLRFLLHTLQRKTGKLNLVFFHPSTVLRPLQHQISVLLADKSGSRSVFLRWPPASTRFVLPHRAFQLITAVQSGFLSIKPFTLRLNVVCWRKINLAKKKQKTKKSKPLIWEFWQLRVRLIKKACDEAFVIRL